MAAQGNYATCGELPLKSHCLPFVQIPHASRLFTDFLAYVPKVQEFYPKSPRFSDWFEQSAAGLQYDQQRRERVCTALERQNVSWDASAKTLENIARIKAGACAVVTGQQVGLFGGPLFSLLKALTAVKLAEHATSAGVECVPIFWLATEDHDLEEVNHVQVPAADGSLHSVSVSSAGTLHSPVGEIKFGHEMEEALKQVSDLLGDSEIVSTLRETYRPGETFGTGFARLLARLFAEWGVILVDASDSELHRIAQPIYEAAVERSEDIYEALQRRGSALEAAGYNQQVKVTASSSLLFSIREGARTPVHRRGNATGQIEFEIGEEKLSEAQLLRGIRTSPQNFSPNVLLRPIVQDYLLPTIAYAGGAAEIAYFAQAAEVYQALLGKITPIVPRFSATLVDNKQQALLDRYGLDLPDIFQAPERLQERLAAATLPKGLSDSLDKAEASLHESMGRIRQDLEILDKTLVDSANTAESKMLHQLAGLRAKAARAEVRHSEVLARHADLLNHGLYPDKSLQEREIAGIYFLGRHGTKLLQELYDTVHPDCLDHQIITM
jgi:bacillithiol biosynthesis cysteine-adding enzyme BshC